MPLMQTVRVHGPADVRIDDIQVPTPGPGDILIRTHSCGICGSDPFYIATGSFTVDGSPMPIGHEFSGTIEAVGEQINDLRTGDRVVVDPYHNLIGNGGPEGAFAPFVLVRDAVRHPGMVVKLPDSMPLEIAALVEPLAVSMHGVNRSRITPGQKAVVLGAGPIGLGAVVVLRYFGVDEVVVADRSERRLATAESLGAKACNVADENLREALLKHHGEAAVAVRGEVMPDTDVYLEATGAGPVLEQCIGTAKEGGKIVIIGVHKGSIPIDPLLLMSKEIELIGSKGYPSEFLPVIDMLDSGKVDVSQMISHRFTMDEFLTGLHTASDPDRSAKVVIDYS